jgi:hypothetical protein
MTPTDLIIFTGCYSALFTFMVTDFFTRRSQNKERENLRRSAEERLERARNAPELWRPSHVTSTQPISRRFAAEPEFGYLQGRVMGMSANIDHLMRRIAKLEANGRPQVGA